MNSRPAVSIVVPAYRSTTTLRVLASAVIDLLEPSVNDFEMIFVDDGSGGETWSTIESIASETPRVRGIRLARNYGQHSALLAGIRAAKFDIIVTMDDDLQHPPSEILPLLDELGADDDVIYGRPMQERQSRPRNAASKFSKWAMATALGPDVYPRPSAFRVFRRTLVDAASDVHDPSISIDVLLSWSTTRIRDIPVAHDERTTGRSGYNLRGLVRHALNMITGYSTRPLHWVSVLGVVCALLGFGLLVFVVVRFITGDAEVAGFTFLAAAITLFSGVQLLSLGVVGEYLGRMHFRTMGRPTYIIRSLTPEPSSPTIDDHATANS